MAENSDQAEMQPVSPTSISVTSEPAETDYEEIQKSNLGLSSCHDKLGGTFTAKGEEVMNPLVFQGANASTPLSTQQKDNGRTWRFLFTDYYGVQSYHTISVNEERVAIAVSQDKYPSNPMTLKSAPIRWFSRIQMKRHRMECYSPVVAFLRLWVMPVTKRIKDWSLLLTLVFSIALIVVFFQIPATLSGTTGLVTQDTADKVYDLVWVSVFHMIIAFHLAYRLYSRHPSLLIPALGVLIMAFIMFVCSLILYRKTGSSFITSYPYDKLLGCKCPSTDASAGLPYSFVCNPLYLDAAATGTCYADSDCGFCATPFYGPYIAGLVAAFTTLLTLLAAIGVSCVLKPVAPKYKSKDYMMEVELTGAGGYGYPLYVKMSERQSIDLQNYLYKLQKTRPELFSTMTFNSGGLMHFLNSRCFAWLVSLFIASCIIVICMKAAFIMTEIRAADIVWQQP